MGRIGYKPNMLRLYRRGKTYHIRGTLNGERIRETTGLTDIKEAKKVLLKRIQALTANATGDYTFGQAIDLYLRDGGEERYIDPIREVLGDTPLSEINQHKIDTAAQEAYGAYQRGPNGKLRKHSKATIKRQFYIPVSAILRKAAKAEWTHMRVIETPKVRRPEPRWPDPDWFKKLWKRCDPEIKRLTAFMMMTGCRIQEALDLQWEDVNYKLELAYIRKTKTEAHRTAYLPPELKPILGKPKEGRVFSFRDRRQVGYFLKKDCAKAGIPYMTTHQFGSHAYATYMRRYAGVDARGLTDTGRWKDPSMADHYTHTAVSEASRKASAIGKLFK